MKKIISVFLILSVIICAFCACSGKEDKETTTAVQITTDSAVIKESDAINLIQSYSDKELGLTSRKDLSFMVANSGYKIDDNYYIEVIATIKIQHENEDGKVTYTFDNKGVYYIRYDGKEILKQTTKDGKTSYDKMKVKAVPTTTKPLEETKKDTTKKK